jgi:hypothetical protein
MPQMKKLNPQEPKLKKLQPENEPGRPEGDTRCAFCALDLMLLLSFDSLSFLRGAAPFADSAV